MEKAMKEGGNLIKFSNINPYTMSETTPGKCQCLLDGKWIDTPKTLFVVDPLNGEKFFELPQVEMDLLKSFAESMSRCTKSGLHNPFKNSHRYVMYGEICRKAAGLLKDDEEVKEHFIKLVQRVTPKSYAQAAGEIRVTADIMSNLSGDNVRFLAGGTQNPGDHDGQRCNSYRWPYGPVALISPFNFPIEIPGGQLIGALVMGNKVLYKSNTKSAPVMEEFIRMLIYCGMPPEDLNLIHIQGSLFDNIYDMCDIRMTQFTGSSRMAEHLATITHGKVKIEDAGFDWKILGPDVTNVDYVAWVCDNDAYNLSGQKCSAQSLCLAHTNWVKAGIFEKMGEIAGRRNLKDLTISPILSWTNKQISDHIADILKLPGTKVKFGGEVLKEEHKIPTCYGSFQPTAMLVPLEHFFRDQQTFDLLTTELFGPFQILVEFGDDDVDKVLQILEKMNQHLTAGVVSNDVFFKNKILGNTVNGTTYAGIRARTTGAPQNHWFGPAGDPRGAGIGTPYAIQLVWSCNREIVTDEAPIPKDFIIPKCS